MRIRTGSRSSHHDKVATHRSYAKLRIRDALASVMLVLCASHSVAEQPGKNGELLPPASLVISNSSYALDGTSGASMSSPALSSAEISRNLWAQQQAYVSRSDDLPTIEEEQHGGSFIHLFAEGGFYMLHPYFSANPAYSTSHRQGPASSGQATSTFDYEVAFSPRVALGLICDNGFGFRASWWRFEQHEIIPNVANQDATRNTTISTPAIPGVPGFTSPGPVAHSLKIFNDQLAFDNHLGTQVWDWEATWKSQIGRWELVTAAGVRYAYISQGYQAFRFNSGSRKVGATTIKLIQDSDTLFAGHNFSGVGPTSALELRRPLSRTGFTLYVTAEGSVLFGSERLQSFQLSEENEQIVPRRGRTQTRQSSNLFHHITTSDDTASAADFEAGADWAGDFGKLGLCLRLGLVNETWFHVGNAISANGHLGFFGLSFAAGLRF
jgi:hypothetical protein